MWNQYYSVSTIDEALAVLAQNPHKARIVAGGTDILIELERHQRPDVDILIDITRVPCLNQIQAEQQSFTLGPLVTHNQVVADARLVSKALPLAQACWEVGAPQIRNRATVAGNLITASPANDTITPLWALGAQVTLRSVHGERTLALPDFYTGFRETAMQPDEMLTAIHVPMLKPNQRGIFIKLGLRRAQAISVVNIAAILTWDGEIVTDAVLTFGSVAPTIIRVELAEDFLRGKILSDEVINEAARLASTVPQPIDDVRASATYRTEMIKVLTARALRRLRAGEERLGFPENPAMLKSQLKSTTQLSSLIQHNSSENDVIDTVINGQRIVARGGTHKTLLHFLRENAGFKGTKEGCAEGECGACTVFLDGDAVMACMVPAPRAHLAEVVTVEGLRQPDGQLHPIQQAFVETGAVQCGFCTPGFLMSGAKLLEEHPLPTEEQIAQSISGNLCRCTGYYKIIEAIRLASRQKNIVDD
ncbi:MAG: hypothetical protein CUN55_01135 [Phototrophicales bacterium]|nr:MAG: hypothetical protein CUN55_01135 [Phototrophicales bacterium]